MMIGPFCKIFVFLIAALFFLPGYPIHAQIPLRVNIFSVNNGKGLEASRQILKKALQDIGHNVFEKSFNEMPKLNESCVDINIFFERLNPKWYSYANLNWFVPNPECYVQDPAFLDAIDLILCRTHEVERIFKSKDKKTYFLGFTSQDCFRNFIEKDFSVCLHLAGGSPCKGTGAIVEAWHNQMLMPNLVLVVHNSAPLLNQDNVQWISKKIPVKVLRYFQNHCGIHLCPSQVEGFGHYLMEAMSANAVVITTDAPPMNEFITDVRCLVPYQYTAPVSLGILYFIDPKQFKNTLISLMALPEDELKKIGENNRSMYLQKTQEFYENLKSLMQTLGRE